MVESLAIWGVAALSVFRPILEDIAKDVAKDAAKSYVGQCFKSVFSVIYKEPLTKSTGQALKELLELIEGELIRADIEEEQLQEWVYDVRRFVNQESVRYAIAALFLKPGYHLDPKVFITAWQQLDHAHAMPENFSWPYVAKRFAAKVVAIRQSSTELQETFASLAQAQNTQALQELVGLPPEFDLETYREALVERYGTVDLASLDTTGVYYEVRLWSVFVAQSVRECHEYEPQLLEVPKDQLLRLVEAGELDAAQLEQSEKLHKEQRRAYVNQAPKPVLAVTDDAAIPRQVILGDPGSGKSSLLRYLALQWARINDANQRYTQPLPLLIELREYNRWHCPSHKGFLKYLHEASTWHRLNQQTLKHLLEQPNRVVLLLDGLDEVFDPAEREQVINDIHRFSNAYKHVRMVVTSRVVGYQPHRLRTAEFRHLMLQDLDDDQIGTFLDRWHEVTFDRSQQTEAESKRVRLDKAIKSSKSIRQLAGNPLLLTMMAVLNRHQELPRDRVDLYQQCSRLLLHQWDTERALDDFPGLSAEIGLREKTEILRIVAYAMQTRVSDESRANYIDGDTLTKLIEDYLCTELRFDQSRAVARALMKQLRERNFILCFLGADSYAFVHRTFLEYFCATEIAYQFNVAKTHDEKDLVKLFDVYCREDDWHEILRLVSGQIDEQFVSRIIEHLATRVNLEEWDGSTPLPELPLAIWCLSESRALKKLEQAGDKLLLSVHSVFRKMRSNSFFAVTEEPADLIYTAFGGDLIASSSELGSNFPTTMDLLKIGNSIAIFEADNDIWLWPELLGKIAKTREMALTFLNQDSKAMHTGGLRALAHRWTDNETRLVLMAYAESGKYDGCKALALELLADSWSNEDTRALVVKNGVHSSNRWIRYAALQALAKTWLDETSRVFLTQRAVDDEDPFPRSAALQALAEKWPDETSRVFLTQRAVADEDASPRSAALRALAEKWPDETSRVFLTQRAVDDEDASTRSAALQALAEKWPDETCALFLQRVLQDPTQGPRGVAWTALGKLHSKFARLLPTRDRDGVGPYLDPLEPVSPDHIEAAAKKAGIPPEDIDAQVVALSAYFGWDIRAGAKSCT
jgi:hypothetical protein